MNKLALGTVQFGLNYGVNNTRKVNFDEVKSILKCAKKNKINTLDTAPSYGNSERILGKAGIDDFHIISKTTSIANGINKVIDDFYQSLDELNRKNIDGLLVHNINEIECKNFNFLLEKLNEFKQKGIVKKIGFSVYTPEQIDFLLENFDFDLIQLPINIFDQRLIRDGKLKKLKDKGIEIHARSIFLQGLLLMSEQDRPKKFKRWSSIWNIWHQWLNDNNITALEACLRYAVSFQEISKVLIGVDTKHQLKEIINSADGHIPDIPLELFINDSNLLNPSNWEKL